MSQEAPRADDDAATLMARVDELTAVVAALGRGFHWTGCFVSPAIRGIVTA